MTDNERKRRDECIKHKRKPAGISVGLMGDLFHEDITDGQIAAVFGVMAATPQHQYFVLTKRAKRRREWFEWIASKESLNSLQPWEKCALASMQTKVNGLIGVGGVMHIRTLPDDRPWPLPNVFLGVSIEDQPTADERIPELLGTPAAVRFVSYEPALEPADLGMQSATCVCCLKWSSRWVRLPDLVCSDLPFDRIHADPGIYRAHSNQHGALSVTAVEGGLLGIKPREFECLPGLDWVIVGGESGPSARPCHVEWIRSIVKQCRTAGVACFVKQLGENCLDRNDAGFDGGDGEWPVGTRTLGGEGFQGAATLLNLRDRAGADPAEWPEDLRVREFPKVSR